MGGLTHDEPVQAQPQTLRAEVPLWPGRPLPVRAARARGTRAGSSPSASLAGVCADLAGIRKPAQATPYSGIGRSGDYGRRRADVDGAACRTIAGYHDSSELSGSTIVAPAGSRPVPSTPPAGLRPWLGRVRNSIIVLQPVVMRPPYIGSPSMAPGYASASPAHDRRPRSAFIRRASGSPASHVRRPAHPRVHLISLSGAVPIRAPPARTRR